MQTTPHYKRAPIIEAILDLKVSLPVETTLDTLLQLHDKVRDEYPGIEPIITGSIAIQPGMFLNVGATQQHTGFRFRSHNGDMVFQVTQDRFTCNRLPPYDRWETFRDEAKRLWAIYREVCHPVGVTRAALRYINRLDLPQSLNDFQDYLRTTVELPKELSIGISGFVMQVQSPQPDLNCNLIINEALAPSTDPAILPVILDFDLFRDQDWASDDETVWDFLEQLRVRKNQLFEASITPAARRLFD